MEKTKRNTTILKLHEEGMSQRKIARRYKISQPRVAAIIRRMHLGSTTQMRAMFHAKNRRELIAKLKPEAREFAIREFAKLGLRQ